MKVVNYLYILFFICITACNQSLEKVQLSDGRYQTEEKLNDSIIQIKVYNSSDKIEAINFKNIKSKIQTVYYFDENGLFKESRIGYPNKQNSAFSYVDCRYFNSKGKLMYRKILNSKDEMLAHFYFDSTLNLKRQVFYNERSNSIRSEIAYSLNGKVNQEISSFLMIQKKGNKLILQPSWINGKHSFTKITVYTYEGEERNLVKEIEFKNTSELFLNLDELDTTKVTSIAVSAIRGEYEGLPSLVPTSILIDNFNNIPKNNLSPTIVKDGKIQSGTDLLRYRN